MLLDSTTDMTYDDRILKWLHVEQSFSQRLGSCTDRLGCICAEHSYPQSNFLIEADGRKVDPRVVLVGHLRELP